MNALELRWYQNNVSIYFIDKITYVLILKKLGNIPDNELQNTILIRKMTYLSHVKRHNCFEKEHTMALLKEIGGQVAQGREETRLFQIYMYVTQQ